jgi:hypothetical protein
MSGSGEPSRLGSQGSGRGAHLCGGGGLALGIEADQPGATIAPQQLQAATAKDGANGKGRIDQHPGNSGAEGQHRSHESCGKQE